MTKESIFTKLFQFSVPTFYAWKKQKRPIIDLLNRYFLKEDLEEFLNTGKINHFDIPNQEKRVKDEEDLLKAFRSLDDKHKKYYLLGIQRAALKKEILEDQRKDL